MGPKLKESPLEWFKFTAVLGVMASAGVWWLKRRGALGAEGALWTWAAIGGMLLCAVLRPRWFRQVYRCGMTVSFWIGHYMGIVLLTLFFFLIITPMGLLLRLTGKDLLQLKRSQVGSYWKTARTSTQFDRQF